MRFPRPSPRQGLERGYTGFLRVPGPFPHPTPSVKRLLGALQGPVKARRMASGSPWSWSHPAFQLPGSAPLPHPHRLPQLGSLDLAPDVVLQVTCGMPSISG